MTTKLSNKNISFIRRIYMTLRKIPLTNIYSHMLEKTVNCIGMNYSSNCY